MEHSDGFLKLVNEAKGRIRETTPEEVRGRKPDSFHLVDVREDGEWQKGHAQGAIHLGKGIIERDVEKNGVLVDPSRRHGRTGSLSRADDSTNSLLRVCVDS